MTIAAERPPLTFRQKYAPWAVVWVIGVVLALVSQALPVGDPDTVGLVGLVLTMLLAPFIVIGSDVRRVRRWEAANGIPERREAEQRELAEFVRRVGFARRPDESLDDAAKRLRALVEARDRRR